LDLFEIALILILALIVLGPERLPEVLRVAGKVLRELRLASNTVMRELTEVMEDEPGVRTPVKPPPASGQPASEPPPAPPAPPRDPT
jgi:Sec-independent protein translocase protein TatA